MCFVLFRNRLEFLLDKHLYLAVLDSKAIDLVATSKYLSIKISIKDFWSK